MRASVSLMSFFSSIRGSIALVPIIRIITPTEPPPPRLSTGPCGIRRWRGALGTLGDLTLQLPSQGLTSGARLALARQGCATGSFRLNCSESLYVKDERGLAMFQRIELEEELEKGRLGLRERPPMLATSASTATTKTSSSLTPAPPITLKEASDESTVAIGVIGLTGYEIDAALPDKTSRTTTRRPSMRTQKRNAIATQSMRFDSGGLSSCATFTEGLCHLEDYVRASELPAALASVDSPTSPKKKTTTVMLPTTHSEEEISELALSASSETRNLSWLESLRIRRKAFSSSSNGDKDKEKGTNKPGLSTPVVGVKTRRSAGEVVKSLSCIDFDMSFSHSDLTLNINMDSCSSNPRDSEKLDLVDGLLKDTAGMGIEKAKEKDEVRLGLRREGSWTRLRRRISKRFSVQYSDSPAGASFGSTLASVFQQRMTTNIIQPSVHVVS